MPVLAVIDYSDMEKDLGVFFQAEVVIWNGKEYTFQWDAKTVVKVISWYPLPKRVKNKIDGLFIEREK